MSATARLARLLALVPWLQANDGITLDEAARHFGVSPEQLEQDLWLVIVCGLPGYGPADLVDIQFWDDGRIHVLDAQTLDRPLRLTGDEARALLLGLRLLAQVPGAAPTGALDRALAKLEGALALAMPGTDVHGSAADPAVSAAIDTAILDGDALAIRYAGATTDAVTDRVVQPLRIVSVDGRTSLIAYCSMAGATRTFRVDRILAAVPRPAIEIATMPGTAPPQPGGPGPLAVRVVLGPSARWVADAHGATILAEGPDGLEAELGVHDLAWLGRLAVEAGPGMRVLAPAEAVAAARERALAALTAYSGGA